jgi:hypothetical protein
MATEEKGPNDFQVVIRILQEKKALIDAAIQSVMAASGAFFPGAEGSAYSFAGPSAGDSQPVELPRGALLGKSIPGAVKLYLSAKAKKQTTKEITVALREGGVESTSDNFEGVITGALHRMKTNGEVLQFKDGWALAEFYPAHIRASLSHGPGTSRKRSKRADKKKSKSVPKPAKPAENLDEKIEAFTTNRQGQWITFRDVLTAFPDLSRQAASSALGRVAKKRGWKAENGKYGVGILGE